MIRISPNLSIPESELVEEFVRASGPGGQNVNKVATAVQLRYNILNSGVLPDRVRLRLMTTEANRISADGWLQVIAQRFRSQARNREDARERLADIVRNAMIEPKRRVKTRPSAASRRRRLDNKRRESLRKEMRRRPHED